MKILFYLSRYPGVGGIENVTTAIVKELVISHEIHIISHLQQDIDYPLDGLCPIYKMPVPQDYQSKKNKIYYDELVEKEQFDLIIYQDSYAPTEKIVCEVAMKRRIPVIVFEHSSPLFVYNKRSLDSFFSIKGFLRWTLHPILLEREVMRKRYLLENSYKYVLLSKRYIPEFLNLVKKEDCEGKLMYINNPIRVKTNEDSGKKKNIIVTVCRLSKEKQVIKMLQVWRSLFPLLPEWEFKIVGDGLEMKSLQNYVERHRLQRVYFVGYAIPDEFYKDAKIYWMMSKFEGWPMSLIEAMHYGCVPIVQDTFSSVFDIVDHKTNGIIVDKDNLKQFKDETYILAGDEQLQEDYSSNARIKAKCFEMTDIINEWNALLEDVAKHSVKKRKILYK